MEQKNFSVEWYKTGEKLTQQVLARLIPGARDDELVLRDPVGQVRPLAGVGVLPELDLVGLHVQIEIEGRWRAAKVPEMSQPEPSGGASLLHGPAKMPRQPSGSCALRQQISRGWLSRLCLSTMEQVEAPGLNLPGHIEVLGLACFLLFGGHS